MKVYICLPKDCRDEATMVASDGFNVFSSKEKAVEFLNSVNSSLKDSDIWECEVDGRLIK